MTVVSTASSGGGLGDYGVFNNERVFTVYIAMKRSPEAEDPTWTLQYALLKSDAAEAGDQAVLAPQPVMRDWPQFSADLAKKYAQRQVVLYAIVDKEGKVSHVSVKQTPDARVSDPIVQALTKWVFRPAQLNSQPVAVKVLLGIPL
jgi:Gram-negative bacterial TonB protein C-terminal